MLLILALLRMTLNSKHTKKEKKRKAKKQRYRNIKPKHRKKFPK